MAEVVRVPLPGKACRKLLALGAVADGAEAAARAAVAVAEQARARQREAIADACDDGGLDTTDGDWAAVLDARAGELVMTKQEANGGRQAEQEHATGPKAAREQAEGRRQEEVGRA